MVPLSRPHVLFDSSLVSETSSHTPYALQPTPHAPPSIRSRQLKQLLAALQTTRRRWRTLRKRLVVMCERWYVRLASAQLRSGIDSWTYWSPGSHMPI